MSDTCLIGGLPVVSLELPVPALRDARGFSRAVVLPGRGAAILQLKARIPGLGETDVFTAPSPEQAALVMNGGALDFNGNASFSMGAAILAPYANRIRGVYSAANRTIETSILDRRIHLPANGGGKQPGAEPCALHGLILDRPVDSYDRRTSRSEDAFSAVLTAGDFGWGWPSRISLAFEVVLRAERFRLQVTATNTGDEPYTLGLGWHPYFALPSGIRLQARLSLPVRRRLIVNNYDEVLPTGEMVGVSATRYDFAAPGGLALGDLFLDDCFVDIQKTADGYTVCEIIDPMAAYGVRMIARSAEVTAIQTYAPLDAAYIAVEPQFSWANPFGAEWPPSVKTGMVLLEPDQSVTYTVDLELFEPQP